MTATSVLTGQQGTQVYSDDFTDPDSGWVTGSVPGASLTYDSGDYVMAVTGPYHYRSIAPYSEPLRQLSETATASLDDGAPASGGFGLACVRGERQPSEVDYEFVLNGTSKWFIERSDGPLSTARTPSLLREGSSPATPGPTAITATAVCATMADGTTMRLALFVNGAKVADLLDAAPSAGTGWSGALLATGGAGALSTVRASRYSENDLAPGGPASQT